MEGWREGEEGKLVREEKPTSANQENAETPDTPLSSIHVITSVREEGKKSKPIRPVPVRSVPYSHYPSHHTRSFFFSPLDEIRRRRAGGERGKGVKNIVSICSSRVGR